jgi:signal peptidase I
MRRLLFLALLGAAGAYIVRRHVIEGIVIATASMEPTLGVGDHILVNKLAYRFNPPQRGDIVVFPSPVENKELVKRVVAVEGDRVEIRRKQVILNGQPLAEPYVQHTRPNDLLKGDNLDAGVVPTGRVFVLGDNRDQSGDSRDWRHPQTGEPILFIAVHDLKGKLMTP